MANIATGVDLTTEGLLAFFLLFKVIEYQIAGVPIPIELHDQYKAALTDINVDLTTALDLSA